MVCKESHFLGTRMQDWNIHVNRDIPANNEKTISRDFKCVTLAVRVCRVVICASWKMKYDVYTQLLKLS
jgi:hypothetical protein